MKRILIGLLALLPIVAHAATLTIDTDEASIGAVTIAQRGLLATTAKADTVGPVNVGRCSRVYCGASWTGDSTSVIIETSGDRTNWTAVSLSANTYLGTASTYGLYFTRVLEPTTANNSTSGAVVPTANTGIARYLRMRIVNNNVIGSITNVAGWFTCVR